MNDCVFAHLNQFPPAKFYMSIMDLVVDGVFYVDIFLNFHTAVWEISKDGINVLIYIFDRVDLYRVNLCVCVCAKRLIYEKRDL